MSDKFYETLARLVPKRLAYWCAVRVISRATVGEYSAQVVPELTAMEALKRWEANHG